MLRRCCDWTLGSTSLWNLMLNLDCGCLAVSSWLPDQSSSLSLRVFRVGLRAKGATPKRRVSAELCWLGMDELKNVFFTCIPQLLLEHPLSKIASCTYQTQRLDEAEALTFSGPRVSETMWGDGVWLEFTGHPLYNAGLL